MALQAIYFFSIEYVGYLESQSLRTTYLGKYQNPLSKKSHVLLFILTHTVDLSYSFFKFCIVPCLEFLGAHSLTVFDLWCSLHLITDAIPIGRARNLTLALEKATSGKETKGPAYKIICL